MRNLPVNLTQSRNLVQPLTSTLAYSAGNAVSVDLPLDSFITQIDLELKLMYDTGSAVTGVSESMLKALGSVLIQGSGGRVYYNALDPRLLHYGNRYDYGDALRLKTMVATTSQTGLINYQTYRIHFGADPHNPYDLSGGINAEDLSALTLQITWPAATQMGTGLTINTGTLVNIKVFGVQGLPEITRRGIAVPSSYEEDFTIAATATDLGKRFDIPTGKWISRALIMVTDNGSAPADERDDTRVTEVGLIVPKDGGRRPWKSTWRGLVDDTVMRSGCIVANDDGTTLNIPTLGVAPLVGIGVFDFRKLATPPNGHPYYGLNTMGASKGDYQIGATIGTANGTIRVLYQEYERL